MQFNLLEIILLLGAGQGGLLAAAFIFSPDKQRSNSTLLFALILLITSWQLIVYTLSLSGNIMQVPHLSLTNRPFMFLIGPLYYFYIKSCVDDRLDFKLWDLLHLLPFIITLWFYKDYYTLPAETKASFFKSWSIGSPLSTSEWVYVTGNLILTSAYFFATFWLIQDEEKKLSNLISNNTILRKVSQLKTMTAGFFLYVSGFLVTLILLYMFESYTFEIDYGWVLTKTLFVHAIGFIAINQPEVFSANNFTKNGSSLAENKYKKSGLSNKQSKYYYKKLLKLMEEERHYLNSNLSLNDLADELSLSPNLLSQVINQHSPRNFSGFVNHYRINHAKKLLEQNGASEKNILEIAMDSGFNTKSSFNRNFKKYTDQTPSTFRNSITTD